MNKRGTPSKHDSLIKEGDAFLQDESKGQPLSLQYGEDEQIKILRSEQDSLKRDLGEKEETLRKLKMVKLYRSKHNLERLDELITKWRETAQEACQQLYETFGDPKPTMEQFLQRMRLQPDLIQFDAEAESFY